MRLSDGLKGKIAELLDRMEAMSKKAAAENRLFDEDEGGAFDAAQAEVRSLNRQLERQVEAERLARGDRQDVQPVPGTGPQLVAADGTILRALRKGEKLADVVPRGMPRDQVGIGQVVRNIIRGEWRGMQPLARAVGETGDQVFAVPDSLSTQWIDKARDASVAFQAGAVTFPMRALTERIVSVVEDPTFTWRKEHKPLVESDPQLAPIDMKARLCGAIVRTSVELIQDSPIAQDLIETILVRAAALEIDRALLAGDGDQTGNLDNPRGLLNWPGVPTVDAVVPPTNYDQMIDAYASVLTNNGAPTAIISSAAMAATMAKVKSGVAGDQTTLEAPALIAGLPKYFTSTMPANTSAVGDFSMLAWGTRLGATIEVTRVGGQDTFKNVQVLIRLIFRGDSVVLRPKWFAIVRPATP